MNIEAQNKNSNNWDIKKREEISYEKTLNCNRVNLSEFLDCKLREGFSFVSRIELYNT